MFGLLSFSLPFGIYDLSFPSVRPFWHWPFAPVTQSVQPAPLSPEISEPGLGQCFMIFHSLGFMRTILELLLPRFCMKLTINKDCLLYNIKSRTNPSHTTSPLIPFSTRLQRNNISLRCEDVLAARRPLMIQEPILALDPEHAAFGSPQSVDTTPSGLSDNFSPRACVNETCYCWRK